MCSNDPLVSVVIAAYNAATTIERALESVMDQNFGSRLEVIVVNDGSIDDTSRVVRSFDGRIGALKLIELDENCGSSVAASVAIREARGLYVCRLDADDAFAPGSFSYFEKMLDGETDIVWGTMHHLLTDGKCRVVPPPDTYSDLNSYAISVDYFSLCGKFIRRTLLTDKDMLPFDHLDCWDDLGVVARLMSRHPKVAIFDKHLYTYYLSPKGKSLSSSKRSKILSDHIGVAHRLTDWFVSRHLDGEFEEFLTHLKFAAKVKYLRGRKRNVAAWKSTFPEVNRRIMGLRHFRLHHRLLFTIVAVLPTTVTQFVSDSSDYLLFRIMSVGEDV